MENTLSSITHACRGKESEDAKHGSKGVAADHGVSSPSMLYPRHVHRQGKEIHYLQLFSSNPPCLLVLLCFTLWSNLWQRRWSSKTQVMICLISSSCQRTTSLPHNGRAPVHCNICGNKKNSFFFRFGLTEIKQKHNSIFSHWRRIWSHNLEQPRQKRAKGPPNNSSICINSLMLILWQKRPGKEGSDPILSSLWRMNST